MIRAHCVAYSKTGLKFVKNVLIGRKDYCLSKIHGALSLAVYVLNVDSRPVETRVGCLISRHILVLYRLLIGKVEPSLAVNSVAYHNIEFSH